MAANVQFADDRDFEAHRKRDTEARKVADEKYLGSLIESCQTKFSEFEAWQKLRVEEGAEASDLHLAERCQARTKRQLSGPSIWCSFAC